MIKRKCHSGNLPPLRSKQGFTVVELIVAIVIMSIMVTIGIASYTQIRSQSRDNKREGDITIMRSELEKMFEKNGEYPAGCPDTTCTATMLTDNTSTALLNASTTLTTLSSVLPGVKSDFGDPNADSATTPFKKVDLAHSRYFYFGGTINTSATTTAAMSYGGITNFPCRIDSTLPPGQAGSYVLGYYSEATNRWVLKGGRLGKPMTITAGTAAQGCVINTD